MSSEMILQFTGNLAPDGNISARTLGHSLGCFQRAIDKIVLFERRGSLRKYAQLSNKQYAEADFLVLPFEAGSIKVPLLNGTLDYVSSRMRGIMQEPYERAASDDRGDTPSLSEQVPNAYARAAHKDSRKYTQQYLIDHPEFVDREYVKAAVLGDINTLLSPVRSSQSSDKESINLTVRDGRRSIKYEFDKETSKAFSHIVRERRLGPEVVYTGILDGLEATGQKDFPYGGKFISSITKKESKLWVPNEAAAHALNPHNLKRKPFQFWGAPVTIYGAFDEVRGDVVFLNFVK